MSARARTATQRPRLLLSSFHLPATGLTRVVTSLAEVLAPRFEVHVVAVGAEPTTPAPGGARLHVPDAASGDPYGAYATRALVERLRPAAVVLYNDLWVLRNYAEPLRSWLAQPGRAPVIAYVPLDGVIRDPELLAPLDFVDRLVVFTRWARAQVRAALGRRAGASGAWSRRPIAVIGHAADTRVFRPLAPTLEAAFDGGFRRELRARLLPEARDWHDAFVVLNANRPTPRKRLDLTLEGFALFARDKPQGVKLWLHQACDFLDERERVRADVRRLGLAARVRLSPPAAGRPPPGDDELNRVYNACDVGLNTSAGEGFGLVSWEHGATGAAQVVPDHGACAELWAGAAERIAVGEPGPADFSPLEVATVAPQAVAAALERLYTDPTHRRRLARAAYERVTAPQASWPALGRRWLRLLSCERELAGSTSAVAKS